jgi:hypothetical protein
MFPPTPTIGWTVTAQDVSAAGNGNPQPATLKFVNAGVLSLMTTIMTVVLAVLA